MKIKHQEIEIQEGNPFGFCMLQRKVYAEALTSIVRNYADGFVLAINNEWGSGKTTFVKMWQQHLKNDNFQTIYFNAWENDFDDNALVAIISEIKSRIGNSNKELFKLVLESCAVLVKNVLPGLIKAIVKKHIDLEALADTLENATKGATEIFEEEIKDYTQKKQTIKDFRSHLQKFIEQSNSGLPLIFIIDELDRCRPRYAIEVLEQLKHLFSVPGIVFVLSIDKNHLAASVRGFYGSEHINTDEYLRRFIDLEYSIPAPSPKAFCDYLYSYYSFADFFATPERMRIQEFAMDTQNFLDMAKILIKKSQATLRQQEKIFGHCRLVLSTFKENNYTFSGVLFFLIFIKILKPDRYKKIENHSFSLQELINEFSDYFPENVDYNINMVQVISPLIHFYNNSSIPEEREDFRENGIRIPENNPIISLNNGSTQEMLRYLSNFQRNMNYHLTSLSYLLDKINLTQPFIV
jgi:hypothetical protein